MSTQNESTLNPAEETDPQVLTPEEYVLQLRNLRTRLPKPEPVTAPAEGPAAAAPPPSTSDFRSAVADYERALLQNALAANRFNQRATASALNLSYDQLRHALKRHKLLETDAA